MSKEELKNWRLDNRLTQKEASDRLCCSLAQYQNWEYGKNDVPGLVEKYIKGIQ